MNLLTWAQLLAATLGLIAIVLIGALALGACRRMLMPDANKPTRPRHASDNELDPWIESAARLTSHRDPPTSSNPE